MQIVKIGSPAFLNCSKFSFMWYEVQPNSFSIKIYFLLSSSLSGQTPLEVQVICVNLRHIICLFRKKNLCLHIDRKFYISEGKQNMVIFKSYFNNNFNFNYCNFKKIYIRRHNFFQLKVINTLFNNNCFDAEIIRIVSCIIAFY